MLSKNSLTYEEFRRLFSVTQESKTNESILNQMMAFSKNDIELAWETLDPEHIGTVSKLSLKAGLRKMKIFTSQQELDRIYSFLCSSEEQSLNFYQLYIKWHGSLFKAQDTQKSSTRLDSLKQDILEHIMRVLQQQQLNLYELFVRFDT